MRYAPSLAVVGLTALLVACGGPVVETPTAPVVTVPTPTPQPADPPATAFSSLRPLGMVEIEFSDLNSETGQFKAQQIQRPLGAQALTDRNSIQLDPVANGSFTLGERGAGGMRYLYATFRVRNATQAGVAYTDARTNLTLVAASTPTTIAETPIGSITRFDGTAASSSIATTILPTHAMTLNRATDLAVPLSGAEDLQVFAENEVTAVPAGATRLFPYGFVVRHRSATANRTLAASPTSAQYDGLVTLAFKLPLQATVADDPFSFTMSFQAMDDSLTRVTESIEEQGSGSAAPARATLLGAGTPIMTLCGSGVSSSNAVFVGSATTAGNTARLARIGGDLALKNPALTYSAIGNTRLDVAAAGGLASAYSAYAGAALTFTGNAASTRGGTVAVNTTGSLAFTSKAGDGLTPVTDTLTYRVADGRTCTSPDARASVNVNGRVWYVRNNTALPTRDGRQDTPFATLTEAQNASAAGDTLYVGRGSGTTSGQNSGITLKNNQVLIGEGAALTLGSTTILAAGTNPALIGHSAGTGVVLAQNNTIRGLTISGTTGGISGSNFGTLTASALSVGATAGPALNLSTGTLAATLTRLDSSGAVGGTGNDAAGTGTTLTDVGGTLSVTGGTTAGSGGVITGARTSGMRVSQTSSVLTLSLNRMRFETNGFHGVNVLTTAGTTGNALLTFTNNAFVNNVTTAVAVQHNSNADGRITFDDNTVTTTLASAQGGGLSYRTTHVSNQTDQGYIRRNQIQLQTGTSSAGNGISVYVQGTGAGRFKLENNTVNGYGTYGMDLAAWQGSGRLDATLLNNTVSSPGGTGLDGVGLSSGDGSAGENPTLCANLSGNFLRGNLADSTTFGVYLWRPATGLFLLPGLTQPTLAGASAAITGNNRNPGTTVTGQGTTFTAGTCTEPNF